MGRRHGWTRAVSAIGVFIATFALLPMAATSALPAAPGPTAKSALSAAPGPAESKSLEADILFGQGRAAAETGAYDRALVCFKQSLALAPHSPAAWVEMGCALADLKRWTEARGAFEQALAALPNDPAALNGLGYVHYRTSRVSEAIQCYKLALASKNDPQYHLNLGLAYLSQESFGQAAEEFKLVVSARPADYWGYNNLGFALQHGQQWRDAAVAYQTAIGLSATDVTAHLNLGGMLLDAHSYEDAATIFLDALRRQDGSYDGHLGLAEALQHLQRPEEAQREARLAVMLGPDKAKAHHLMGEIYASRARWAASVVETRRAVALEPKIVEYRLTLARVLEKSGRTKEAALAYEQYLALIQEGPEARDARMHARLLR
jgi:Flp pilus assembly protein TadD